MQKERRIVLLINPIAGTSSKQNLEQNLVKKCGEAGMECMVMHSTQTTKADNIRAALNDFAATDLVACGGDGTVNMAAAAITNSRVNLGIIPVGSGNGLARTAAIPLNPTQAFEVVLQGTATPTDAFSVNGVFACMLSGIGLDAEVAEKFAQSNSRGLATYTTHTLIQFFKAHPVQFEIALPEFKFFTDAFFISVANSNQFGNNVTIAPMASLCDGLLDVVIVQKMPKAKLPFALIYQLRHNKNLKHWMDDIGKKNILYFQTPEITIGNGNHAPLHIDGDPYPFADRLHFKIIPAAFNLWVPKKQ